MLLEMQEYFSEAIVLDRLPNGDLDSRVFFFTKRFGKLIAKAKSARKITSKLAAHLEPGNLIQVRLVEKNGLQVVDALKKSRLAIALHDLYCLSELLAEAEPESRLWELFVTGEFSWHQALKLLGWDPDFAVCTNCSNPAAAFRIQSQEFFCSRCSSKLPRSEVLYI